MTSLYRDLLSNSPQTVTIPIPSDMGTGQIAQVVTKQGAVVSDWKMNYFSDMNVRGINSEDYIQMLFCLNDGVSWNIAGSRAGACLAKGESCIYRGHGKMESLCYAQNSDFYFKNIKIPVPYFKRLLQDYFEDGEITVYEKKLLTGISNVSITPYMEHIFAELQDFTHYRGGLGYLFLESKIHELLSVYLSEVLELRILSPEYCCISKSERDCIIEAKRIIDSELAFAPVDLNEHAMRDEWSGDLGVGCKYFSQDAVIKLAPAAGIALAERLTPAEKLKEVQKLAEQGVSYAQDIFKSIGVYLGHTLCLYEMFYDIRNLILLGRVASGVGGDLIVAECQRVLNEEYPELSQKLRVMLPDEEFRRVGQSMAAASLPEV